MLRASLFLYLCFLFFLFFKVVRMTRCEKKILTFEADLQKAARNYNRKQTRKKERICSVVIEENLVCDLVRIII